MSTVTLVWLGLLVLGFIALGVWVFGNSSNDDDCVIHLAGKEYEPDYPVKELWELLQANGDYGWSEYEDSGNHYYSFDFNGERYYLITYGMLMFVESKSDNFNWMSAKDVNWLRNKISDEINKAERIKLEELRKKVGDDIMVQLKQTEE